MVIKLKEEDITFAFAGIAWVLLETELYKSYADNK